MLWPIKAGGNPETDMKFTTNALYAKDATRNKNKLLLGLLILEVLQLQKLLHYEMPSFTSASLLLTNTWQWSITTMRHVLLVHVCEAVHPKVLKQHWIFDPKITASNSFWWYTDLVPQSFPLCAPKWLFLHYKYDLPLWHFTTLCYTPSTMSVTRNHIL